MASGDSRTAEQQQKAADGAGKDGINTTMASRASALAGYTGRQASNA